MIAPMKKLKTILQSNYLLIILLSLTILSTIIRIAIKPTPKYTETTPYIIGTILRIEEDKEYLSLIIQGKEKVKGTYFYREHQKPIKLEIGDKVKVIGKIEEPESPTTKYLFDYAFYLKKQNIYHTIQIEKIIVQEKNTSLRNKIKQTLNQKITDPYIKAFLLGQNDKIKEEVKDSYQVNGISHLFAISGMQFYLLASIMLKGLKRVKVKEKTAYKIIYCFLFLYLLLLGITPSIIRGLLFFIFFSVNRVWKLEISKRRCILYAILLTILINPYFITEAAFWYSFTISIALLYFSKANFSYLKSLITSSILAFIFSIPISLYYFYEINPLSMIYNLFYIPYINYVIFPMSILTLVLPILSPIYQLLILILEETSLFLKNITFLKLTFPRLPILVYILELIIIIYYYKTKKKKAMMAMICIFFLHYFSFYVKPDYIKVIDVGQGDAILIFSKGKTALIDTGGIVKYDGTKSETISKYTTIPLLKSEGIKKIDHLILTHGDMDHIGEFFYLNNHFKIKNVYLNLGQTSYLEKEIKSNYPSYQISTKEKIISVGDFTLQQLNKNWKEENTSSSVYYVYHPNLTMLLMGDATTETEAYLMKAYQVKADVIKLGHHGSNTSSSKKFLTHTSLKLAIISVGKENRYHHPSKEVINRLETLRIPTLQTKNSGTITIYPKTKQITEDKKER